MDWCGTLWRRESWHGEAGMALTGGMDGEGRNIVRIHLSRESGHLPRPTSSIPEFLTSLYRGEADEQLVGKEHPGRVLDSDS